MDAFETEIKALIVDALMLEDVPDDLQADADLFATFGLDSVDALELAHEIRRKYGVEFDAEDDANKAAFTSIRSLASFVRKKQAEA